MKTIMVGLGIGIAWVLGWFYSESTAGVPATISTVLLSNVYQVSHTTIKEKTRNMGTGVWVNSRYLITNCHVAEHMETPVANRYDGKMHYKLDLIACDKGKDLSLYKSHWPNHSAKELRIDWRTPRFGMILYSAGYGENQPMSPKMGLAGVMQIVMDNMYLLGMTLPIAQGDSGSPLLDRRGNLRGLMKGAFMARTYRGQTVPVADKSVALSGLDIKSFLEEYMDGNEGED